MIVTATTYSIKQASELAGLTASVLRIWELRYGWPRPHRKANGYRFYAQHQVDELLRIAAYVKEGVLISSLIKDGIPCFPTDTGSSRNSRVLTYTRSLAAPADRAEAQLHGTLLDALEQHRTMDVQQLLQRIFWTVRPQDEAKTAFIPTLIALQELSDMDRPMPEAGKIIAIVRERCQQLLRMQRIAANAVFIVPSRGGDDALAAVIAVVLCHRGVPARLWTQPGVPTTSFITATAAETDTANVRRRNMLGSITLRGNNGTQSIVEFLNSGCAIGMLNEPVAQ